MPRWRPANAGGQTGVDHDGSATRAEHTAEDREPIGGGRPTPRQEREPIGDRDLERGERIGLLRACLQGVLDGAR